MCVSLTYFVLDSYLATLWESNCPFGFPLVMFPLGSSYFVFVFLSLWCLWWEVWDNCIGSWSLPSLLFCWVFHKSSIAAIRPGTNQLREIANHSTNVTTKADFHNKAVEVSYSLLQDPWVHPLDIGLRLAKNKTKRHTVSKLKMHSLVSWRSGECCKIIWKINHL